MMMEQIRFNRFAGKGFKLRQNFEAQILLNWLLLSDIAVLVFVACIYKSYLDKKFKVSSLFHQVSVAGTR